MPPPKNFPLRLGIRGGDWTLQESDLVGNAVRIDQEGYLRL